MKNRTIYILNGPNLNLLGERKPEIYGHTTLRDIVQHCQNLAQQQGFHTESFQSNHEGQLVEWIQQARKEAIAIIINAAAYTHTSIAILDALEIYDGLVVEVHLSNIHERESFRQHSYISQRADHLIIGKGAKGYDEALQYIIHSLVR